MFVVFTPTKDIFSFYIYCNAYPLLYAKKVHSRQDLYCKVALSKHGNIKQLQKKNAINQIIDKNKCNHLL